MTDRSFLYVPGNRPDRFDKAWSTGTDAVIFDLEDAVPVPAKAEALAAVTAHLAADAHQMSAWVRLNPGQAGLIEAAVLLEAGARCGFVLPKATVQDLVEIHTLAPDAALVPLVESARAILEIGLLAAAGGVVTLALGEVDLSADLGLESTAATETILWPIRAQVVVAAAAAHRASPVGPVSIDIQDLDAFAQSTRALKAAGFGGRQVVHPRQVAVVNAVFTPTDGEIAAARRLLELGTAHEGVCVDDNGRMIDEAVLRSARRLLDRVRRQGGP